MKTAADNRITVSGSLESIVHFQTLFIFSNWVWAATSPRHHKVPFLRLFEQWTRRLRSSRRAFRSDVAVVVVAVVVYHFAIEFSWLLQTIYLFSTQLKVSVVFYCFMALSENAPFLYILFAALFDVIRFTHARRTHTHTRGREHRKCKSISVCYRSMNLCRLYKTSGCSFRSGLLLFVILFFYLTASLAQNKGKEGEMRNGEHVVYSAFSSLLFLSLNICCLHFGPSAIISIFFPFVFRVFYIFISSPNIVIAARPSLLFFSSLRSPRNNGHRCVALVGRRTRFHSEIREKKIWRNEKEGRKCEWFIST